MPLLIESPTIIAAVAGRNRKIIQEFFGAVNSRESGVSIAHMRSPGGWVEPGQRPEVDEYTLVLRGVLRVEHEQGVMEVPAGQAIHTRPGEWIRYSTPGDEGAENILLIRLPAFSSTRCTATPIKT